MNSIKALGTGSGGNSKQLKFGAAARQFGIDQDEMGQEAEVLWNQLNEMAQNDPQQYEKFIQAQMQQAKDEAQGGKSIMPALAFTIRTLSSAPAGSGVDKPLYINLCSHRLVENPTHADGSTVREDSCDVGGLSIPLAISPLRDLTGTDQHTLNAVDVLVSPWVVARTSENPMFLSQVAELAKSHVAEDTGLKIAKRGDKILKKKHAVADPNLDVCAPVRFVVEPPKDSSSDGTTPGHGEEKESLNASFNSPTDLLNLLSKHKEQHDEETEKLFDNGIKLGEPAPPEGPKKQLIQELGKKKPTFAKGFLAKNDKPLYADKEAERQDPKNKGFWERAKVVDMNDPTTTTETVKAAIDSTERQPQLATSGGNNRRNPTPKVKHDAPSDNFLSLAAQVDDELRGSGSDVPGGFASDGDASFMKDLSAFSKLLNLTVDLPQGDGNKTKQSAAGTEPRVPDAVPEFDEERATLPEVKVNVKKDESKSEWKWTFHLPMMENMEGIELDMSTQFIKLDCPGYQPTVIRTPKEVNTRVASAKFKKKTRQLVVRAPQVEKL